MRGFWVKKMKKKIRLQKVWLEYRDLTHMYVMCMGLLFWLNVMSISVIPMLVSAIPAMDYIKI